MKKLIGFICIVWGLLFSHLETTYFGNNFWPQTNEEMACDFSCVLMVLAGILLIKKQKIQSQ